MILQAVIEKKSKVVESLVQNIKKSGLIILFEFQGLKVSDFTELRIELKKINSTIKLYPKNILKRAFKMMSYDKISELSRDSKALLLGADDDVIAPIKILSNFAKKNTFLKIVIGIVENKIYSKNMIDELSLLGSKENLLAVLSSSMLFSLRELLISLHMLQEQKNIKMDN
ncbi:50S ribosomal protein L10 [Candidatus Phytoplasma luffae]|uniref:Large ribosomal subunit protein uL10 n=1 Tax=Loofah witches'-broom phytoplasma TaxID=35773 RepID=A0A975FI76_LOWBP|nr:50S ribosomal protein L10 [Candidatus Phytoplasma luffae]QTX02850.1 50S ribosomal protein L10 [Candidatus Phytoplasma luffae]